MVKRCDFNPAGAAQCALDAGHPGPHLPFRHEALFPPTRPMCARHEVVGCDLCDPFHAHPMADAHDLLEARCAELERENRTAHAEGFLRGREEAAGLLEDAARMPNLAEDKAKLLRSLAAVIRGDAE